MTRKLEQARELSSRPRRPDSRVSMAVFAYLKGEAASDCSKPKAVPAAGTSRLQARDVARAFDTARAVREYWVQPARKPALRPPARAALRDAEGHMRRNVLTHRTSPNSRSCRIRGEHDSD